MDQRSFVRNVVRRTLQGYNFAGHVAQSCLAQPRSEDVG